ncbi:MAG: phenylalanine--tRNA ligase subunit beta [Candidatus Aenigmarchaeota archaeon]|nr:phenylalanine--tRNA ligase subunit beta [Candidatus Aenigmarchaeota archaeon]
MPKIEVSYKDLCNLVGRKLSVEELKDAILFAKGEIDAVDGDLLKIDVKDTNRPDLWSAEGIAREIQGRYTKNVGCPKYSVGNSNVVIKVDKKMKSVRPYTVCVVARNLKLNKEALSQLIQLQVKVDQTFGRNRREFSSGYYDLDKIKSPINFTTVKPDGIKFVPLEFREELTPKEILEKHPKGKEFGHLLAGYKEYPIFIDAKGEVLSIPPIINSNNSGQITEKTKNIFLECSGFNLKFLLPALNVMACALADRGARIETVKVAYPDKTIVPPDLTPRKSSVDIEYLNKISGLHLNEKQITNLLGQARYDAKIKGSKIEVVYPAYRQDIMHQRDVVEDVIISFGYNKIEPVTPKLPTVGSESEIEKLSGKIAEIMVGLGLQEVLSYTLTNSKNLFDKMNLKEERIVGIENAVSDNWNVFRNWLLPSLLEFLSANKHVEYPQKIFEIGDAVLIDESKETKTRDVRKLACAIADSNAGYQEISSMLDAFLSNAGVKYKLKAVEHNSFLNGRVASVLVEGKQIGVIGEINPVVLENWNLEIPVAAFEVNLDSI